MTTDALLGGIETVRNELQTLIDCCVESHPLVSEDLAQIDGSLEDIELGLEPAGLEEELYLDDADLELLAELREEGVLTPADFFDPFEGDD